jgi:hypothetical protein
MAWTLPCGAGPENRRTQGLADWRARWLEARLRELAICATARHVGDQFEWVITSRWRRQQPSQPMRWR